MLFTEEMAQDGLQRTTDGTTRIWKAVKRSMMNFPLDARTPPQEKKNDTRANRHSSEFSFSARHAEYSKHRPRGFDKGFAQEK